MQKLSNNWLLPDASRPATIAAYFIRWPFGAKRLTTSGFSRQHASASKLASALAADPRRLCVLNFEGDKYNGQAN